MKLVSFNQNNEERLGLSVEGNIYDMAKSGSAISLELPSKMIPFLEGGEKMMDYGRQVEASIKEGKGELVGAESGVVLLSPVPRPVSARDAYAFRQHVAAARRNRGVDMIPEFDQFPIFYFTNPISTFGPGNIVLEKDHFLRLDFELEVAVVIGKAGKNIPAEKADEYIAGYMIMNDFSARQLQMEEMKLNLGPAKGKDFANAFGPYLVTPDELASFKIETPAGQTGDKYDLKMTAIHNGKQVSEGSVKDMTYTFAEIIERCSYGCQLVPGEVIGSGTVGTGCYLELNGTWKKEAEEKGEEFTPVWLEPGDTIEMDIAGLGKLVNKVVLEGDYSILAKKKNL